MVKSAIYTGFIFEYKERRVSLVANILRGAYLRSSLFLLFCQIQDCHCQLQLNSKLQN